MGLDRNAIYVPQPGEILTVLGTKDNQTTAWAFQLTTHAGSMQTDLLLRGKIIGARFAIGLDNRLRTQRESIDRLMKHLGQHCPALRAAARCEWMETNDREH